MPNPLTPSTGDSGSAALGITLPGGGKPADATAPVTVGHTWVIIVGALALLWILGGTVFRTIRM